MNFYIISISGKLGNLETHCRFQESAKKSDFFRTLLGQPGHRDRKEQGEEATRKGPNQLRMPQDLFSFCFFFDDRVKVALFACSFAFSSCPHIQFYITGITDKVALKQNECHLLGLNSNFQSLEQTLPWINLSFSVLGFFLTFFFFNFEVKEIL